MGGRDSFGLDVHVSILLCIQLDEAVMHNVY